MKLQRAWGQGRWWLTLHDNTQRSIANVDGSTTTIGSRPYFSLPWFGPLR